MKSDYVVGIGFERAAEIYYQANTNCLTRDSNFEQARQCTALAAADEDEAAKVHLAWDAVGVPGGNSPTPSGTITLQNVVAVTGQSGSTGNEQHYTLEASGSAVSCSIWAVAATQICTRD